jgi:hypothetical protein
MKIPADIRYIEEMLCEAMEMLEELQPGMGLFQRQCYGKLKRQFDQQRSLSENLRAALGEIETVSRPAGQIR